MNNALTPMDARLEGRRTDDDDEIDLLKLWLQIWRRKWSITALTLVVMMLTTLIVLNMTPIYRAVSTLLIEQRTARAVSIEEVYGIEGGNEYLQTQFELLKSRALAERVVTQLRLFEHPEFDPRQQDRSMFDPRQWFADFNWRSLLPLTLPEDLEPSEPSEGEIFDAVVRSFMERTNVSPLNRTQLVRIEVDMADRDMAAMAANAIADGYIESQLEARMDMNTTATVWMNERLVELRQKLQESERRLQEFREQENLVDLEGITTVSANELARVGDRLADARRARSEAESSYNQIASLRHAGWERLLSAPAVMRDPLVQEFRTDEARARSRVDELSRRYGPKHPQMVAAQTELLSATVALQGQVQEVVNSIERNYQLAVANERSLESSFQLNRSEIQEITRQEFRLRELDREVETNRQLYETFLTRLKETSATQDFDAVNARIVDRAVAPLNPVKPKKTLIVLIAGLLAGFIGVGLALLLDMLNNTFKNSQDVENQLNLPVLGITPLLKGRSEYKLAHSFADEEDKAFSESIRTIRTSVVLTGMESNQKVILVTSSVPGEGKSTVAANLASSLSQLGKVILVDADLRRPSLRRRFELAVGVPGVANVVAGTAQLADCLVPVSDGFDLIHAGTVPPNPQELLSSPRFAELIEQLRESYDHVIIDSPPALAVSDSILLAKLADSVIYVIKSLATSIPMVQRGVGGLLQRNAPISGVVLNQVDLKKAERMGYSYGGYYDYYGYSSDQGQRTKA